MVGGGVIGVCASYFLSKAGMSVTLLERGEICSGSSYGNAGWIVPSHSFPLAAPGALMQGLRWMFRPDSPFHIKPRFDLDLFRWLRWFRAAANSRAFQESTPIIAELGMSSLALYDELIDAEGIDCHYERRGLLGVFRTREGREKAEKEARLLEEHRMPAQMMTPREVVEMEPVVRADNLGGIYFEQDANLKPDEFVLGLASRFQQMGGTVRTHVVVQGFETRGGVTSVRTSAGAFQADHLVLAAGSWTPRLAGQLGIHVPVQAAKGYSVTFDRPADSPTRPVMMAEARCGLTPMGRHMRIAGTLELSGINNRIRQGRVDAIVRAVGQHFTTNIDPAKGVVWSGLRPLSPDGLPVIGSAAGLPNVVIATGHSMTGMTLGPVTGKLVAQLVTGDEPIVDPAPFSPSRFA